MKKKMIALLCAAMISVQCFCVNDVYAEQSTEKVNAGVEQERLEKVEKDVVPYAVSGIWIKDPVNGKWWYKHSDGTCTKNGWEYINGQFYYFDAYGWMVTGWQKVGNYWYYLGTGDSGYMRTGWQVVGNYWYYFGADTSGYMRTGWQFIDSCWYYFGGADSGYMRTGWCKVDGIWYYLHNTGVMNIDPIYIDGSFYTFYKNGELKTTELGVLRQQQEQSRWCWAASAVMIGKYKTNSTVSQVQAVKYVKGSPINEGGTDAEVIEAIRFVSNNTKNAIRTNPLTLTNLINKIDIGRPFGIHIAWDNGGGHMIVGAGYNVETKSIYAIDPWESTANRYYNYANLVNGTTIATGTGKCISLVVY